MSNSDSDSVDEEYESADEGLRGEDIDISELGLDDDDDDVVEIKTKSSESKPSELVLNTEPAVSLETDLTTPNLEPFIETKTIESSIKEEEKEDLVKNETNLTTPNLEPVIGIKTIEPSIKEEKENLVKNLIISQDQIKLEDDDEINKLIDEMNIEQTFPIVNTTNIEEKSDNSSKIKESTKKGDWDDDDLNIDDEELDNDKNIPKTKIINNNSNSSYSLKSEIKETPKQSSSSWSWSSFGSSLANVASQLGTGLNQVVETLEQSIGAPDPVELALAAKKAREKNEEINEYIVENEDQNEQDKEINNDWNNDDQEWFTINTLTSKGSQLVAGSLNVLETVGKKTFETLNDRDPNLKMTRDLLNKVPTAIPTSQKPNLSQLLREAKQAREESPINENETQNKILKNQVEKLTFSLFFEEFKGTINLEALEMLSHQASVKTEMNSSLLKKNNQISLKIKEIEQLFKPDNLNDDMDADEDSEFAFLEDFKQLISDQDKMFDLNHFQTLIEDYADQLSFKIKLDKLVNAFQTSTLALKEIEDPTALFNESIKCFALITSKLVESFHKFAELIAIEQQSHKGFSAEKSTSLLNAQYLFQITRLCIRAMMILADDFCKKCRLSSKDANVKSINLVTTDIYLEVSNSSTYMGDTFLLFQPIFKSLIFNEENQ